MRSCGCFPLKCANTLPFCLPSSLRLTLNRLARFFFSLEKEGGRSGKAGLLARETLLPGRFQESGGSEERGVEADPESGQIGGRRRSGRRTSGSVNRDKMTKADLLPQWREGGVRLSNNTRTTNEALIKANKKVKIKHKMLITLC